LNFETPSATIILKRFSIIQALPDISISEAKLHSFFDVGSSMFNVGCSGFLPLFIV